MSTRLTCPGCGRSLSLPSDCTAETLSCPRCLARIANPQAPAGSTAVQAEAPSSVPAAATATGVTERGPWTHTADVDVSRDSQGTSGCMIVLMVLGGLGLSLFVLSGLAAGGVGVVLGVLTVLTILSAIGVFFGPSRASAGTDAGRIVRGVLAISGVAVLLVVSVLIFVFFWCAAHPVQFGR